MTFRKKCQALFWVCFGRHLPNLSDADVFLKIEGFFWLRRYSVDWESPWQAILRYKPKMSSIEPSSVRFVALLTVHDAKFFRVSIIVGTWLPYPSDMTCGR